MVFLFGPGLMESRCCLYQWAGREVWGHSNMFSVNTDRQALSHWILVIITNVSSPQEGPGFDSHIMKGLWMWRWHVGQRMGKIMHKTVPFGKRVMVWGSGSHKVKSTNLRYIYLSTYYDEYLLTYSTPQHKSIFALTSFFWRKILNFSKVLIRNIRIIKGKIWLVDLIKTWFRPKFRPGLDLV